MMRILLCTADFDHPATGSGGVARMIAAMANGNFSIDIVSEDVADVSPGLKQSSVFEKWPFLVYSLKSKRYWRVISEKMKTTSYDVLFFNDIWLAHGASAFLKDQTRKEAVVAFMHDDNTLDPSGTKVLSGRWLSFQSRAICEKRVIRYLDAVLTNSEYLKGMFLKQYPGTRCYRLYYTAMDYRHMPYQPKQIDPKGPIKVLFMKSDFERGGLKELIHALRSLSQYHFELTVAGSSQARLHQKLGNLLENKDQLKIHIIGQVSDQTTIKYLYHTHDIVCVPSRKEALGLVNAEALASGVPVVSTGVGGIPEVLDHGSAGIMVKGLSSSEIAEALHECITHVHETAERVAHGREFVLTRFSVESMYNELYRILHEVCKTLPRR